MTTSGSIPAFPIPSPNPLTPTQEGMSLRDWFAGQALAGLGPFLERYGAPLLGTRAYEIADAMLKAREQPSGG